MGNLRLGDWESVHVPPSVGTIFTAQILGTTYQTIIMPDGKEWMSQNLRWSGAGQWWNSAGSDDGDGRYYTASDAWSILAPALSLVHGWRLPTLEDFEEMRASSGGASIAGDRLKTIGTDYWTAPNSGASDLYGFSMRGSGRYWLGAWVRKKEIAKFWLSGDFSGTGYFGSDANAPELWAGSDPAYTGGLIPIRLVRDYPVPLYSSGVHDILIDGNGAAENLADLRQRVDIRLRTFFGEHWLNPELGVPWFRDFLVKSPDLAACRQILVAVIQDVPGIVQVESLTVDFAKSSRQLRVSFSVSGSDSIPQSGLTAVPL